VKVVLCVWLTASVGVAYELSSTDIADAMVVNMGNVLEKII